MNIFTNRWLVAGLLMALPGRAAEITLESTGVRGSTSNPGNRARFYHVEGYVNWNLPWRWKWGENWSVQSRLDLTGGWMNGRGDDAVFGTIGPSFELSRTNCPVGLDVGCSPTILGREEFGNTDYGTVFQFTTHAGLTWKPGSRWSLGCRFEHMSNADLGSVNPGLNLYSIGVGWRF